MLANANAVVIFQGHSQPTNTVLSINIEISGQQRCLSTHHCMTGLFTHIITHTSHFKASSSRRQMKTQRPWNTAPTNGIQQDKHFSEYDLEKKSCPKQRKKFQSGKLFGCFLKSSDVQNSYTKSCQSNWRVRYFLHQPCCWNQCPIYSLPKQLMFLTGSLSITATPIYDAPYILLSIKHRKPPQAGSTTIISIHTGPTTDLLLTAEKQAKRMLGTRSKQV